MGSLAKIMYDQIEFQVAANFADGRPAYLSILDHICVEIGSHY